MVADRSFKEPCDWDNPADRLRYLEQVGSAAYNTAFAAYRVRSVIECVNGHDLRYVASRFGRLVAVGDTGRAFSTLPEAQRFAQSAIRKTMP